MKCGIIARQPDMKIVYQNKIDVCTPHRCSIEVSEGNFRDLTIGLQVAFRYIFLSE